MRSLLYHGGMSDLGASMVVVFFLLFLGLVWRVYRSAAREEMSRGARLPLEEGNEEFLRG